MSIQKGPITVMIVERIWIMLSYFLFYSKIVDPLSLLTFLFIFLIPYMECNGMGQNLTYRFLTFLEKFWFQDDEKHILGHWSVYNFCIHDISRTVWATDFEFGMKVRVRRTNTQHFWCRAVCSSAYQPVRSKTISC